MKNRLKLTAGLITLALVSQASAFFGFDFNVCTPAPVYVRRAPVMVYQPTCCHSTSYVVERPVTVARSAPVGPTMHVGFGSSFDSCRSGFGLGFSIPLGGSKPALFDDADQTFWQIYNDIDTAITVSNSGNTKKIKPGKTGILKHRKNFNLTVEIDELNVSRMVTRDSHSLVVRLDDAGKIHIDAA